MGWAGETSFVFDNDRYIQVRIYVKKGVWNKFKLLVKANNWDIREEITDLFETWIKARSSIKK